MITYSLGYVVKLNHVYMLFFLALAFWIYGLIVGVKSYGIGRFDGSMCDALLCWREVDSKLKIKEAFMAWCIWADRNTLVFSNKSDPHNVMLARVAQWVEEHITYVHQIYHSPSWLLARSPCAWTAPPRT